MKSDPYAFEAQCARRAPAYLRAAGKGRAAAGAQANQFDAPISIYEVHLGSWRRHTDNNWLSYRELADQLVRHAKWMGFTHLELLPVNEHPFDGRGLSADRAVRAHPSLRHPGGFSLLLSTARRGLNVILDWVPGHFLRMILLSLRLTVPRCMNTATRAKAITRTGIP